MSRSEERTAVLVLGAMLALTVAAAWYAHELRAPVTLTVGAFAGSYWGTPTGESYQILDEAVRRLEEAHPNVEVRYVSGIRPEDYSEWLAGRILEGEEPDLFFVLPEDLDLLAVSGALADLDGWMDSDPGFDASLYYGPCLRSGVFDGRQYALPYESVPTLMFVNETLLEEAGIPAPDDDWTWDDLYRICRQVTDVEERRFGIYGYTWIHALYANGASLFSEDGTACHLSDPRTMEAIRSVQALDALSGGYQVTARDFDLGNVAFRPFLYSEYRAYQPYPWRVKKYSGFEWGCVAMPAGPYGDNVSELHTMLLGIGARSRHPALAWELAKLLSADTEVQKELYTWSHGISPLRSVAEDREILARLREDVPGKGGYGKAMIRKIMSTAVVSPRFDGYDQVLMLAESAVADAMEEDQVSEDRILRAQREIDIVLGRH